LSALIIGTWTPDFEYVLLLRPGGKFGHTPLGILVFCLPLGLAVWAVFQGLVAPALLPLLPPGLERRAGAARRAPAASDLRPAAPGRQPGPLAGVRGHRRHGRLRPRHRLLRPPRAEGLAGC